jgi:uncharacterized repeat protein (TIGR03803 family)
MSAPLRIVPSHSMPAVYKALHSFGKGTDGRVPVASLIDVNGTLYGTTIEGGAYNGGTVFSISTNGSEKVLHSFGQGSDGAQPGAGLLDVNGTFYGTTENGGAHGGGTVFSISTGGSEKLLYSFGYSFSGSGPAASLINVNGTLYGTTFGGGAYRYGTVFSISTSGTEKVLHSFGSQSDGKYPSGALVDLNKTLYGTTQQGGTYHEGTVFGLSIGGNEEVLHSFGSGSDGQNPLTGIIDVNNSLYGTTPFGGASGSTYAEGTVFTIGTSGSEKVLHAFGCCSDGTLPFAGLIEANGTIYGTTGTGGSLNRCQTSPYYGCGTVFSMSTDGTEKVLHSFSDNSSDGGNPDAALIDVNGTLYGTTAEGGAYGETSGTHGEGTVFSLTTTGSENGQHDRSTAKVRR